MSGWPEFVRDVQTGSTKLPRGLPQVRSGTLVLDDQVLGLPGGVLSHVSVPVHYLDLNGAQAHSLSELGGSPELWAGVTKLYASNGALRSLQGLELLCNVRFLYLDHNELPERELLMLSGLPRHQLECLDIQGNPGFTDEVMQALMDGEGGQAGSTR
ncbi:hypothetical protein F751_0986 [Auxenochlorella protothecoides]|nr:hypothetical protein F751_0986 [Auxenochlorella protothecoides]KFM28470.1 hypothetical protein F751_0986 [Auxenochlorella protothecoides]